MYNEYDTYLKEIEAITHLILPYVPRGISDYTDHGVLHSERVIKYCERIFIACKEAGIELNEIEKFLVRSSAWLHDIGNLTGRKNHPEKSCEILDYLNRNYFEMDSFLISLIKKVIISHSEHSLRISKVPRFEEYDRVKIRLRLVCALFRLADECDINYRRATKAVHDLIKKDIERKIESSDKEESEKAKETNEYWIAHQNIDSVVFDKDSKNIIIIVYDTNSVQKVLESIKKEMKNLNPIFDKEGFPYTKIEIKKKVYGYI